MTIKLGSKWRHKSTGNLYVVDDILPIKINGEWDDAGAVIYTVHRGLDSYVRLTADFLENFEEVEDE